MLFFSRYQESNNKSFAYSHPCTRQLCEHSNWPLFCAAGKLHTQTFQPSKGQGSPRDERILGPGAQWLTLRTLFVCLFTWGSWFHCFYFLIFLQLIPYCSILERGLGNTTSDKHRRHLSFWMLIRSLHLWSFPLSPAHECDQGIQDWGSGSVCCHPWFQ